MKSFHNIVLLALAATTMNGCQKHSTNSRMQSGEGGTIQVELSLAGARLLGQQALTPVSAHFKVVGGAFNMSGLSANFDDHGLAQFTVAPDQPADTTFTLIIEDLIYAEGSDQKTVIAATKDAAAWAVDSRVQFSDAQHSVAFGTDIMSQLGKLPTTGAAKAEFIVTEFTSHDSVRARRSDSGTASSQDRTTGGAVSFDRALPLDVVAGSVVYDSDTKVLKMDIVCTDSSADGDVSGAPMNLFCQSKYLFGDSNYAGEVFAAVIPMGYDVGVDADSYGTCARTKAQDLNIDTHTPTVHGAACDQAGHTFSVKYMSFDQGKTTFEVAIEGIDATLAGISLMLTTGYSIAQIPVLLP